MEDWVNCEEIGRGAYGVVHKQFESRTGRYRAVKTIDKSSLPRTLDCSREPLVMTALAKDPSLFVQIFEWREELNTLFIVMEYVELGNLKKHLDKPLAQETVQRISRQLLQGLKVMHEKGIAHRDLKPENIFVVSMTPIRVKLGDFGISKQIRSQDLTTLHTQFFTPSYTAPEVLGVDTNSETSDYTNAVDIWSLGCVIYEALVGAKLFHSENLIYAYFHKRWSFPEDKLKSLSSPVNDVGISLIKSMVSLQPDDRPSATEALSHEWIEYRENEPGVESSTDGGEGFTPISEDYGMNTGFSRQVMLRGQANLVGGYRLETEFFKDHVRHTRYSGNSRLGKEEEEWSNCEILGMGGFSVVHKQLEGSASRCRAVKAIDKRGLPVQLDYSRDLLGMAILAEHELFVQFLGWYEDRNTLYIAMECLENGNLRKHIKEPLPQETTQKITKQLLEGLDVMHQNGIAHGNLKPENIFVVSMSPVWVKLGDFSISKGIQAQDPTIPHLQLLSRVYSAPEVLGLDDTEETSDYTGAVDIWSLGCVIYELLVGAKLFRKEGQIARYFFGGWSFPQDQLKSLSPPISDSGISLIESMISLDPDNRPSVIGALGHAWLTSLTSET